MPEERPAYECAVELASGKEVHTGKPTGQDDLQLRDGYLGQVDIHLR